MRSKLLPWLVMGVSVAPGLAGCALLPEAPPLRRVIDSTLAQFRDRNTPDRAESALATREAPPTGTFTCDLAGVFEDQLSEFRLIMRLDRNFDLIPLPEQGIRYQGAWTHAPERHQIGFYGGTQLDYAFYDQGAGSLIIHLKPNPDETVWVAFCDRLQ